LEQNDTYKTIAEASEEILFKEKNSKFFGYAFPISNEDEVKKHIEKLRKQHFGAGHFCYAFQLGTDTIYYRANDDGEPSNSAGMPIYGQIQSFGITNVLVVVVRFFGGVKLGVGGLISAYRTTAHLALEQAEIIEKTIQVQYKLTFDYKNMNKVMRIIKERQLNIVSQNLNESCELVISTRKNKSDLVLDIFTNIFEVKIEIV
jgi:uncharacterized YigZ family protein